MDSAWHAEGQALLAPFDSLILEQVRTECPFGMRYRIEIYTPAPKRVHSYYVQPLAARRANCARPSTGLRKATTRVPTKQKPYLGG